MGLLDDAYVETVGVDVFGIALGLEIVVAGLRDLMGTALGLDKWCPVFEFDLVNPGLALFGFVQDFVLGYNNFVGLDLGGGESSSMVQGSNSRFFQVFPG